MKEGLERYGIRFSGYGSERRSGPTIGMALITLAHYDYTDLEMFRLGSMAPVYTFLSASKDPVGISRDHRSFYDIMRRLKPLFKLDIDLTELKERGDAESDRLKETLDRLASSDPKAKEIIDKARADYSFTPYVEHVELAPELDKALDEIIQNTPEQPEGP